MLLSVQIVSENENKKRPERAPERPPWRILCAHAHRLRLVGRLSGSVVPVLIFAVATAS